MIGRLALLGGLAALLAVVGVYATKFEAVRLEAELAALRRAVTAERRGLHALKAEWAYLNRPQRLAVLAERYLDLRPATPEEITSLADLAREHEAERTPPLAALLPSGEAVSLRLKPAVPPRVMGAAASGPEGLQ